MKLTIPFLICSLALLGPLAAGDSHAFTSRDGAKSFQAELTGYDIFSKMVTVRRPNGRVQRFKVALLSEKDQEYVRSKGPALAAMACLRISCDMDREKSEKSRKGNWERKQTPCSYTISLENTRNNYFDDVSIDYVIFCERNPKSGGGPTIEKTEGSKKIGMLLPVNTEHVTTEKVVLNSWTDNPPIPSGGSGGGG